MKILGMNIMGNVLDGKPSNGHGPINLISIQSKGKARIEKVGEVKEENGIITISGWHFNGDNTTVNIDGYNTIMGGYSVEELKSISKMKKLFHASPFRKTYY